MTENIVARVARLVSGGVNDLVDAVENATPETVMKEAIREVDRATDQVRDELGQLLANKHLASVRLMETSTKHEELGENVRIAIDEGREDLAEAAVSRQLDLEAQIPVLEAAIKSSAAEEQKLEGYIAALQARKREMEEEMSSLLARETAPGDPVQATGPSAVAQAERKTEKAESAFNRVIQSTTGLPGTAQPDRHTAAQLGELEKLSRDNRVRERLASIKAQREQTTE
jgi:phage shock protein A